MARAKSLSYYEDFKPSHTGGLTYWRNPADPSEEYLFVSSNGKVGRYRIFEEGTPGGKRRPQTSFDCLDLDPPETIDTAASSFVSTVDFFGRLYLLVEKYCPKRDTEEKYCAEGEIPYAYLFHG